MKKAALILAAVALTGLVGYRINKKMETNAQVEAHSQEVSIPAVTVEPIASRQITPKVVITGNVRPDNEVDIPSRTSGRIVQVKVKIGDKVKAGDVLALVEQEVVVQQLKQAKGALAAAQANLMNMRRSNESAEALAKESSIAEVQLVGSRAGLKAAEASVMQAEAAVALVEENLKNTRITSPIEGVVTKKNTNVGAMVSPGGQGPASILFQVQNTSHLKLETSVDEREVKFVKPGQPVRVSVDAWPGDSFTGKVALISPSLDAVSRRAAIEVSLDNPDGKLFANMFAQGELLPSESHETLAVPRSALLRGKDQPTVYVVKEDMAELRTIRIGESDGTYSAVLEGLQSGEQVIISGHSRVTDGAKVQVQPGATTVGSAAGGNP